MARFGGSAKISSLPIAGRVEGMRVGDLEIQLKRHIERDPGHTIQEGYHRYSYDDVNNVEYYTIFADSALSRRKYSEETKWFPDGSGKIIYKKFTFYDQRGNPYKSIKQTNFVYSTDGKERIMGIDAVEIRK